jgi:hypothetical protein
MEDRKIAARSRSRSLEPRKSGRSGTHRISNKQVLADRRLLAKAYDLLAGDIERRLRHEHGVGRGGWTITPIGFRVPDHIARRLISCSGIEVCDPGLFPGVELAQTYRARVPNRIISGRGRARASSWNEDDI